MQATNGSASSFRSRGRLIGCCMALALAVSAMVLAPSAGAVTHPVKQYVALGDSLAFGYTQEKFETNKPNEPAAAFGEGYDYFYLKKVKAVKAEVDNKGTLDINLGCPGETTLSFKGVGSPFGNCSYAEVFTKFGPGAGGGPLHTPYPGKSQLAAMLSYLKGGAPAHPITVISLNIGANDELAAVAKCKAEVKSDLEGEGYPAAKTEQPKGSGEFYGITEIPGAINACVAGSAPALFGFIGSQIKSIITEIYETGKYTGKVVLNGYYNPFTFILPGSDALQKLLNEYLEGAIVPTFGGKVVFANPFVAFNGTKEGSKGEETKICTLTEMCNPNAIKYSEEKDTKVKEKEATEGKKIIYPFNPKEGDIHPTKKGYAAIANVMFKAYNGQ